MNSRQRVKMALNHQEPDRIPFDLGGLGSLHASYDPKASESGLTEQISNCFRP